MFDQLPAKTDIYSLDVENEMHRDAVLRMCGIVGDAWAEACKKPRRQRRRFFLALCYDLFDHLLDETISKVPPDHKPACFAGCSHCCHVSVDATPLEAGVIADHVRSLPAERRAEVIAGLRRQVEHKRATSDDLDAYAAAKVPCAFLSVRGDCSIYPIRPLLCRGYHSVDAQRCADALQTKGAIVPHSGYINLMVAAFLHAFTYVYHVGALKRKKPPKFERWEQGFFPLRVLTKLGIKS